MKGEIGSIDYDWAACSTCQNEDPETGDCTIPDRRWSIYVTIDTESETVYCGLYERKEDANR